MQTVEKPVTGRDEISDPREPLAALTQFYQALNSRDMALMEKNWRATEAAVMDNPLGGAKRGWKEIRSVYETLFRAGGRYQFEFYDYTLQRYAEIFVAIGRERGYIEAEDGRRLDLAIRTTRVFHWDGNDWRQIHHHGSIDDPEMLSRYQRAVLKRAA
jgi:hypothetical protein